MQYIELHKYNQETKTFFWRFIIDLAESKLPKNLAQNMPEAMRAVIYFMA